MGREKNTWQRDMQTDKQVGRQTDRQNSSLNFTFWAIAERGYFIYSSHNKAGTKFIWYDLVKKVLLLIQKISFSWLYACLIKDVNNMFNKNFLDLNQHRSKLDAWATWTVYQYTLWGTCVFYFDS